MSSAPSEVTGLLKRWTVGDLQARDHLVRLVYNQLRPSAHRRLRGALSEKPLSTNELVREDYLRLADFARNGKARAAFDPSVLGLELRAKPVS